jgi:hypothetical protein
VYDCSWGQKKLLFAFNLKMGDSLYYDEGQKVSYTVDSIYNTVINAKKLKAWRLKSKCPTQLGNWQGYPTTMTIVEKLGPDIFFFPGSNNVCYTDGAGYNLRCYTDNNFPTYRTPYCWQYGNGQCGFLPSPPAPFYKNFIDGDKHQWNVATSYQDQGSANHGTHTSIFKEDDDYSSDPTDGTVKITIIQNGMYKFIVSEDQTKEKVYLERNGTKILLYDFKLPIGGKFDVQPKSGGKETYLLEKIDTVNLINQKSRLMTFKRISTNLCSPEKMEWLVGIGSLWGPLYTEETIFKCDGNSPKLLCSFRADGIVHEYGSAPCIIDFDAVTETDDLNSLLHIAPNPAEDFVQISIPEDVFTSSLTLNLTDIYGRVYYNAPLQQATQTITLNAFPKGLYFIRVLKKDKQVLGVKKIVWQ